MNISNIRTDTLTLYLSRCYEFAYCPQRGMRPESIHNMMGYHSGLNKKTQEGHFLRLGAMDILLLVNAR